MPLLPSRPFLYRNTGLDLKHSGWRSTFGTLFDSRNTHRGKERFHGSVAPSTRETGDIPLEERARGERRWTILTASYPLLEVLFERDGRLPLRLRLDCDGWNGQPPAMKLLSAGGGAPGAVPQGGGGQFNLGPHPITGLPFVCMVGSREYHTHSSHTNDAWESYRRGDGYDLGGLVTQVWRAWLKARS